jgi:hypothetical protein
MTPRHVDLQIIDGFFSGGDYRLETPPLYSLSITTSKQTKLPQPREGNDQLSTFPAAKLSILSVTTGHPRTELANLYNSGTKTRSRPNVS